MAASIIVSFFNANDYELPKRYLQETLEHALSTGREVISTQAVLPGQKPLPWPDGVRAFVYEVPSYFFYKENLWNMGAKKASGDSLIFIDADVIYKNPDWVTNVEEALKTCDVLQPFTKAMWLDEFGHLERDRVPNSSQLVSGERISLGTGHPGFGWAMTKEAYEKIGGWYDIAANGAGDVAFVFSLASQSQFELVMQHFPNQDRMVLTPSFRKYRKHVSSLGLTVGEVPECLVHHKWHGTIRNRRYCRRDKCLPRVENYEYDLNRRADGILVWGDEKSALAFKELFSDRLDDGTPPKVVLVSKDSEANNIVSWLLKKSQFEIKTCDGNCVGVYITPLTELIKSNLKLDLPVLNGLVSADCLSGYPACNYWREIADEYSDVKFILYYKDPDKAVIDRFNNPKITENVPYNTLVTEYRKHTCDVLDYFKDDKDRFLLLTCDDYADNFKRLAEFLDLDPFPTEDYGKLLPVEKSYKDASTVVITGTPGAWLNLLAQELYRNSWQILYPDQEQTPDTALYLQRNSQNIECQKVLELICKKDNFELFSTDIPDNHYEAKDEVLTFLGKFSGSPGIVGGVGNWAFLNVWSPYISDVIAIEATEVEDLHMLNLLTAGEHDESELKRIREFHLKRYRDGLKQFKHVCHLSNDDVRAKKFDKLTTFLNSRF